jgi:hypothetical protein
MTESSDKTLKPKMRIVAGVLAVFSLGVVIMRFIEINKIGGEAESVMNIMKLIFPLSVALFAGYIAWKGVFPFNENKRK